MLIRVIDLETTGLPTDPEGAAVCEAAYCDVHVGQDNSARVSDRATSFFVNPGRPIPIMAQAVHHITDADVQGALLQEEALGKLIPAAPNEANVFYCAHRADFEREFFAAHAAWICTYKVALRLWPDAPAHSNQVLRYFLGLQLKADQAFPPHRAGPDAYVTAHILAHCINDGRATIEQMHRWADGPALLPRINFGKHKGSKWEDVPADYLEWVATKSDLDRDVKANAKHHLKKRVAA